MATIIDVAKKAGVSKSTVSRVLTNNGYVSEESKQKVLDAMDEIGYIPNLLARQLQSGVTKTIGFIAPSYMSSMGKFLQVFMESAKNNGYFVNLYLTSGDKQKEIEALNQLKYKQVDGIFILTRTNEWDVIKPFKQYGPLSTWNRIEEDWIYSSYVDHYEGYLMALNYLYKQGYQKIGHVLGFYKNLNTKARVKALKEFHEVNHLPLDEKWLIQSNFKKNGGRQIANMWLESTDRPEVLAFYSDQTAAEFISEIELLGFSCPKDVGVLGFDNNEVSELMHISTVDYSLEKQASNSFAYLYNELNEKKIPIQELKIQLIERKTLRRL
ncbi:LacI family DNA-binding transcriptional regulator [Vagococcus fluvialis]|uniref:LacI family DNA-binding transcriptional regulator n=1 Tax=Vagococcus fluvialis TaxID=2738 RepID=UPI001D0AABB8|nr:LacI family DNA-binding transcriptional regulator [Vagococcus fluvialis]MCM2139196.1 LacI family DNA-binding transcriptional regulator [Vagococcus fluvialis]UDM71934.1 LacI family DNA-binding transcriptional regulator [Vagococcus fluvialis]UDM76799.1 LacI family DNA-binding transcriptional regulator [Vagococcus fluvialis]UDM80188.1 LacI family DNA-binding transcriptional regulator [Vagococcus fluvialis]UDM83628.1 LacI family DNA-binding transcriptional regulator [Vagococcus fluvialis]